jgi:hypothetical protein
MARRKDGRTVSFMSIPLFMNETGAQLSSFVTGLKDQKGQVIREG